MEIPFTFMWDFPNRRVTVQLMAEEMTVETFEMLGHAVLHAVTEFKADVERGFLLRDEDYPQFTD